MRKAQKEAARPQVVRVFSDPALQALAEARRAYLVWRDWPAYDDIKGCDAAGAADCKAWWALVDAVPTTITGAVEAARFMLEREGVEDAPNLRKGSNVELNIAALAAAKVLPFFAATDADPAIVVVQRVQAARDAWAAFPDDRMEDAEYRALQDEFNKAREILRHTVPVSAIGAGLMAAEVHWGTICGGLMDDSDVKAVLLNIASAFAPSEERAGAPTALHAIAAE